MPVHLTAYRERRVLKRFHASSLSVWNVIGSQVLVAFVIAILGSILLTVISMVVYQIKCAQDVGVINSGIHTGDTLFYLPGSSAGSDSAEYPRRTGSRAAVVFCDDDLGGAGPPREVMSSVMNYVGDATPIWYVIQLLQEPWLGFGWQVNASLIVGGITIVATALSVKFFKWD